MTTTDRTTTSIQRLARRLGQILEVCRLMAPVAEEVVALLPVLLEVSEGRTRLEAEEEIILQAIELLRAMEEVEVGLAKLQPTTPPKVHHPTISPFPAWDRVLLQVPSLLDRMVLVRERMAREGSERS